MNKAITGNLSNLLVVVWPSSCQSFIPFEVLE